MNSCLIVPRIERFVKTQHPGLAAEHASYRPALRLPLLRSILGFF